jgi:hypothetical protein
VLAFVTSGPGTLSVKGVMAKAAKSPVIVSLKLPNVTVKVFVKDPDSSNNENLIAYGWLGTVSKVWDKVPGLGSSEAAANDALQHGDAEKMVSMLIPLPLTVHELKSPVSNPPFVTRLAYAALLQMVMPTAQNIFRELYITWSPSISRLNS